MTEETKTEKVEGQAVIEASDNELVGGWMNEAQGCTTPEAFQKLSERLLSDVCYSGEALPLAYTAIALAALKMAFSSRHGTLDLRQRQTLLENVESALGLAP